MTIVSEWLNYITNFRNCLSHKASCRMFSQESGTSLMAFYETPNTQIQSPSHYCYTIPAFMAGDFGAWAWEAYPSRKFAGHGSYVITMKFHRRHNIPKHQESNRDPPWNRILVHTNSNLDILSGPWSALQLCPRALKNNTCGSNETKETIILPSFRLHTLFVS